MDSASTSVHRLALARTLLFVPGNRPERFAKAIAAEPDAVVLDLEDSVPPDQKAAARTAIGAQWPHLLSSGVPLVIRINALPANDDLHWLRTLVAPSGVMVPKAESAGDLRLVSDRVPNVPIVPLIESASGFLSLNELADAPHVLRLALGHIDFMADTNLQCSEDQRELDPLRFAIAMATRARRLAPAIDGVTVQTDDKARLREDTLRSLRFGFGGKLCIHPKQIGPVHEAMLPSDEELTWARRVLAADADAQGAAVQLDGRMVDLPVVIQARRILERSAGTRAN